MIRNYLLIAWRSMMKNRFFIMINILGLATGIACCVVAYFNWEYSAVFDKHHEQAESIYRVTSVREFDGRTTRYGLAPLPLGEMIRQNIADVNEVVRISWSRSNFKVDDDIFPAELAYAEPGFFRLFSFEFISGDPGALADKSRVLISDEMAMKLYNSLDVIGRPLTQAFGNTLKEYLVGGVFRKQPASSSFRESAIAHYDNYFDEARDLDPHDWRARNTLFLQIEDPARVEVVHKQLQGYRENNNKVREDFLISEYEVEPFVGMARRDMDDDVPSYTGDTNPIEAVVTPAIMAIMVLLIACFNMTNSAIAISSRRLKEIGVRKVMGSLRSQLVMQFLGETAFICLFALVLGLFLGEVLMAGWNALWVNMELTSHYSDNPGFVIFILGVLVFTALVSGGYPAFYISRFEPVAILIGKHKFGQTSVLSRVLLGAQYALSLMAIVFALAFYGNAIFQRDYDIGFDHHSVVMAYVEDGAEYEMYRNALMQNKDITAVAGAEHGLFSYRINDPVRQGQKQLESDIYFVGDGYLNTMGLTLLQGRDFIKDSETDRRESVLVTENFVNAFGWDEPLGQEIVWKDTVRLYVIGVIKNVYTAGMWREMDPLMLRYAGHDKLTHVSVKAPADKVKDVNAYMEAQWKEIFPNRLYNGWYLNEPIVEALTVGTNIVKMCAFLGAVALILSITGLFTLVSLNIIRRTKEIGVRKVLGASIGNIARVINMEFVIILIFASILGCVMSYYSAEALMSGIWKYYQSASFMTFAISVVVMLALSLLAIGYKVWSAASMNPVKTLRDE